MKVELKLFLAIGGTKDVFMKVALMSFFNYRWDKCHVLAIGGTYVDLIEGGTNVGGTNVGGTNVGGTNVGWTNVCGSKVAASHPNIAYLTDPIEANINQLNPV